MPELTLQQAIDLAQSELQAGRVVEADSICRQLLAFDPKHPQVLQIAARIAFVSGRGAEAASLLQRAITADPANSNNYGNLGSVLAQLGRTEEAIKAFEKALAMRPNSPATYANLANAYQSVGRIDDAIDAARKGLAIDPKSTAPMHTLANALATRGDLEEAIKTLQRALEIEPGYAEGFGNLGALLRRALRHDEALNAYQRFAQIRPDLPDPLVGLAGTLLEMRRAHEAVSTFQQALSMRSDIAEAEFGLGASFRATQQINPAIDAYRRAVKLNPNYADAWVNLGQALVERGDAEEAIDCYQKAIAIRPDYAEAYNNLAVALNYQGRVVEAIEALGRALAFKPDYGGAYNNLAMSYEDLGRQDEAINAYQRGVAIDPESEILQNNLGNALREAGRIDEAVKQFHATIQHKRVNISADNFLFTMSAHPDYEPKRILQEHREWERDYALHLRGPEAKYPNIPDPNRRLRIGYVSPDFSLHPVGRFMLPLIGNHDVSAFEIFCYYGGRRQDRATDEFMKGARAWRSTLGLTDEQLIDQIRQDKIDILVDLAMHTKDNRLLIFARKPAPVQATYLAYAGTTGLSAIDYRLTDPYIDPPGQHDELYVEKSIRLPHTYWCYRPLEESLSIQPAMPVSEAVTFGSLNNFWKVNPVVIDLWGKIMQSVPGSRMIMHAREGSHRNTVLQRLAAFGVDAGRVRFEARTGPDEYFRLYNEIDVALDPFPYPGGTTTCDALFMGVPVVTLAGKTGVARGGVSLLSNVGIPEFIAQTPEQYVEIAINIAADAGRRSELRATLRQQMQRSPVMDEKQFARDVEASYKDMWRQWCDQTAAR